MPKDRWKVLLIGLVVIVQVGLACYVTWFALHPRIHERAEPVSSSRVDSGKNDLTDVSDIYKKMLLDAGEIDASAWTVEPSFFRILLQRPSKNIRFFKASATVDDNVVGYLKELRVHHLVLTDCHVTARCLKDIASIGSLEFLEISHLRSRPEDWRGIAALDHLRALRAKSCNLNDRCLQILGSHPFDLLDLRGNGQISDAGVAHLKREKLHMLGLAANRSITVRSALIMSQISSLETIDLAQTDLGDDSLVALAKLKNLRVLNLRESLVTDSGLSKFKPPAKMQKLILYHCNKVTASCIRQFQARYPGCFVELYTNKAAK